MQKRRLKADPAAAEAARRELIEKLVRGFQQVQNSVRPAKLNIRIHDQTPAARRSVQRN